MNEKYNDLIKNIELQEITLLDLNCKKNPEFNTQNESLNIYLDHDIKQMVHNGINVFFPIFFKVFSFESSEKESINDVSEKDILFKIEFTLELNYIIDFNMVEDVVADIQNFKKEFGIFAEKNVPINAWPYARELVSNMTTKMGFPPLLLPMYKNIPKY